MKIYRKIRYKSAGVAYFPKLERKVINAFSWGENAGDMHYSRADDGRERLEIRNRIIKFLKKAKLNTVRNVVNMREEHDETIVNIDRKVLENANSTRWGKYISCDAFFTKLANVTLATKPGDCITAIVYCRDKRSESITGIIHTGRKGVDKELPRKAVEYLKSKFGVEPEEIELGFVPHLSKENRKFEHIKGIRNKSVWKGFIEKKNGFYYPDEFGAALKQYLDMGVSQENIYHYKVDTYEAAKNGEYFSHNYYDDKKKIGKKVPEWRFMVGVRLLS